MVDMLSPYELLRLSKPKPAPTHVTAYDLYSTARSSAPQSEPIQTEPAPPPPAHDAQPEDLPVSLPPVRRTHYISDIKSRHDRASRRSSFHPV